MKRFAYSRCITVNSPCVLPLALMAALASLGAWQPARAQSSIIAIGPPSFQTLAGPSLGDEILYRLTFLGPREPGDLLQLARLAELRSIATLASIRTDQSNTVASVQLERDGFGLWNATDAFDQAIWYLPPDVQNLAWSRLLLTDVETAYGRLDSSLGGMPALSPRGAFYLRGISSLVPLTESALPISEAEISPASPLLIARPLGLDVLRKQSQLLVRNLAELIRQIKASDADQRERETVASELSRLLELASPFDRILALEPTLPDVLESFRLVIRGARPAEAVLTRIGRPGTWRLVRDGLNAMSETLQLPRSIVAAEPPRPVLRRATDLLPRLDQAIALVAAVGDEPATRDGSDPLLAKLWDQARRLEIKLLLFRQHVLTAEPVDQLGPRLREIETLNQQLAARARPAPPLFQGGRRNKPFRFQEADRTINGLRAFLSNDRKD
jgi:hypothetical protein